MMLELLAQSDTLPTSLGVTLMAWLVGLSVVCLLAYSLMTRKEPWDLAPGAGILGRLRKRLDQTLRSIKDLEQAHESNSISEEEFRALRNELKLRAISIKKDLDRARRSRLRSVLKARRGLTPSQRKHIEGLVRERQEKLRSVVEAREE